MSKKPSRKPASTAKPTLSGSPMDVDLLQQIVALMSTNDLNTVDVRDGDKRVILKRGAVVQIGAPQHAFSPQNLTTSQPVSNANAPAAPAPPAKAADDSAGLTPIKSPMVGTFYASSSPDAKPFVAVGSTVDDETDVCIIEAMKVFNNIKAETKGTIAKILVTNGSPVEFGQTLFLVKP